MKRMAVVGCGSMGTLLGACLTRSGYDIDLIDVNVEHIKALNERGATVIGQTPFSVSVHAKTPDEMEGKYDIIFLLIKQTYNDACFKQIQALLSENGLIITMQNGIPEIAVAKEFGEDRTLGCAVTWAASYIAPGVTSANTVPEMWNNTIGRLDGKKTDKLAEVVAILSKMCRTEASDNLAGLRWSKLIINSSFSGMGAAIGASFGQTLDNADALYCAQHVARECIRVSSALGVRLYPIGTEGYLDQLMDFNNEEERIATEPIYRKLFGASYDGKSSMLQDIEKGLKTEIQYINGIVSSKGRECGIATPYNDTLIDIVNRIERNELKASFDNLKIFKGL